MYILTKANQLVVWKGTITALRVQTVAGAALIDNVSNAVDVPLAQALTLHTGSVTQANMRISAVAGTAFVDTADATFSANLVAHLGKYLKVTEDRPERGHAHPTTITGPEGDGKIQG